MDIVTVPKTRPKASSSGLMAQKVAQATRHVQAGVSSGLGCKVGTMGPQYDQGLGFGV